MKNMKAISNRSYVYVLLLVACVLAGPASASHLLDPLRLDMGLDVGESDLLGDAPDPNDVHIQKIAYAGSGCPAGTVSDLLSEDAKAFTLLFDSYVAEAGPGIALSQSRKNCQIAVDLRFPQGFSYTVFEVDYRGFIKLDPGTGGVQKSTYYFQGNPGQASLQSNFSGPLTKDYHIRDSLGLASLVWSPCGATRALNMNTQVRVSTTSSAQRALMTTDSIDGIVSHVYKVQWRRCF